MANTQPRIGTIALPTKMDNVEFKPVDVANKAKVVKKPTTTPRPGTLVINAGKAPGAAEAKAEKERIAAEKAAEKEAKKASTQMQNMLPGVRSQYKGLLDETRQVGLDASQGQRNLAAMLEAQAMGEGPSLAEAQAKAAGNRAMAQQMAVQGARRGGRAGLIELQAQRAGAEMQTQLQEKANLAMLQERASAQSQLAGVWAQARAGDLASQQLINQIAQSGNQMELDILQSLQAGELGEAGLAQQWAMQKSQERIQREQLRNQKTAEDKRLLGSLFQAGGAGIGAFVGSSAGPAGTIAGAQVGSAAGGAAGNMLGTVI